MELGKLLVPGHPTIWIAVGQWPTALVVGAGGACLDIFTLIYPFLSSVSLSLPYPCLIRKRYCTLFSAGLTEFSSRRMAQPSLELTRCSDFLHHGRAVLTTRPRRLSRRRGRVEVVLWITR